MARTTRTLNLTNLALVNEEYPSTHFTVNSSTWYEVGQVDASVGFGYKYHDILFTLPAWPDTLKHNKLYGIQFTVQAKNNSHSLLLIYRNNGDYDASTVTWYTAPESLRSEGSFLSYSFGGTAFSGDINLPETLFGTIEEAKKASIALGTKSFRFTGNQFTTDIKTVLTGGSSVRAVVAYDNSVKIASKIQYLSGPKDGYANPRNAISFSWEYVKANDDEYCAIPQWTQASAVFHWKTSDAESYNDVAISGSTASVTIAKNTFPTASTIEWYVSGTDEESVTSQTEVFSFSTSAGTITAEGKSPVNTVEDGAADITFKWALSSTDGQAATRVEIRWKSESQALWTNVGITGAVTEYTFAANTFPAGVIYWQVRGRNIDGTYGPWAAPSGAESYSFISVRAPDPVRGLNATEVPYTTISWQSSEQQAYEISIDDVVVKKAFGADVYSWTVDDPLADGTHRISVRVQGQYGFWSQANTINVIIQNTPGVDLELIGEFDIDALLSWVTASTIRDFYVYRDGKRIAHTGNLIYVDRFSLGEHSYYVINKLGNGNYTLSNTVRGVMTANGTFISPLNGSGWINITRSENSATEQSFKYERKYSIRHVSGAVYPVLELAPFEDFSGSYDFACKDYETAKAFESLRGKEIIVKSRGDVVLFGAMVSLSSHYGDFINGFTFNIQKIHVEEYIDDANS